MIQGIDPKLFWLPSCGINGFVIHTSSSQIVLPTSAYDAFGVVVVNLVKVLYGQDPEEPPAGFDVCFNTTDPTAVVNATLFFTPSMVLEFEGGVGHLKLQDGVPFQEVPDLHSLNVFFFTIIEGLKGRMNFFIRKISFKFSIIEKKNTFTNDKDFWS